jgi:hypothetical protein
VSKRIPDKKRVNESFNNIVIHQNYIIMKLSSNESKVKITKQIKGFFDTNFIKELSIATKFVQRKSKLQGLIFFSYVYLQPRQKEL